MRALAAAYRVSLKTAYKSIRHLADRGLLEVHPRQGVLLRQDASRRAREEVARRAARRNSKRLAILIPDIHLPIEGNPFYNDLATALVQEAPRHGVDAEIVGIAMNRQIELADQIARRFDAAYAIGTLPAYHFVLYALWSRRFPVAIFNREVPGPDISSVWQDDFGAAERIGEILLSLGHRDVCMVASQMYPAIAEDRGYVAGWLRFLNRAGTVASCSMPLAFLKPGMEAVLFSRLLDNLPRITALVLAYPQMVDGLIQGGRLLGRGVPGDLSLASMRSSHDKAHMNVPTPISWFELDARRAAQCAMEIINRLLVGEARPLGIRLPMRLRRTGSVGPAPQLADRPRGQVSARAQCPSSDPTK